MRLPASLLAIVLALSAAAAPADPLSPADPLDLVDPMIGTMGAGFVFPGPAAPYGMVQLSPDTEGIFAYTGYQWIDRSIRGFSHVHVQSMGVPEGGNLPFMPTTGAIETDVLAYQTPFSHAREHAKPGYYSVELPEHGITAELTAGLRTGVHRYTFPATDRANVLVDAGRQIPGGKQIPSGPQDDLTQSIPGTNRASLAIVDDRTIIGTTNLDRAAPHGYAVHFVARFDRPFATHGTWSARGAAPQPGATAVDSRGAGAYVTFDTTQDRDVEIRVGISFVSVANAIANLDAEDAGFDETMAATRASWRDALKAITVRGGTLAERVAFQTALYHAQHHPNVFNDVNGEYLGHDGQVHRVGAPGDPMEHAQAYYANFSLWDTYRGEMQLLALIAPDRYRDMMRSLAAIAKHHGRIPRWALMNGSPDYMQGEPALISIADGYCRDLVPADVSAALYEAMRLRTFDIPRDAARLTLGWVPNNPSGTLEHALGTFALALVADKLGKTADRDRAVALAGTWRNVFDPETRFMRPRDGAGNWRTPYLPEAPDGWVEGTGWQYTWLVPHDLRALFDAIGPETEQRLDTFFSFPVTANVPLLTPEVQQKITAYGIAYAGNQYAPSNEHDLHAPFLYDWLGMPWKTQALSRAYQGLFRATPDGLPGNDDLGSMSAWFVWSAIGMYPAVGGAPIYALSSPLFEEIEIRVPGGVVTIDAAGASAAAKYVTRTEVNGTTRDAAFLRHDDLEAGDSIAFRMSIAPSLDSVAPPPSLTADGLGAFGC